MNVSRNNRSNSVKAKALPLFFKDDPDLPLKRKVKIQTQKVLNDKKEYTVEISYCKLKLWIILVRKRKHYTFNIHKTQGKRMA